MLIVKLTRDLFYCIQFWTQQEMKPLMRKLAEAGRRGRQQSPDSRSCVHLHHLELIAAHFLDTCVQLYRISPKRERIFFFDLIWLPYVLFLPDKVVLLLLESNVYLGDM